MSTHVSLKSLHASILTITVGIFANKNTTQLIFAADQLIFVKFC